jgi:DNA-directed RNA polymerase subunit H (RpoH/RPB5)
MLAKVFHLRHDEQLPKIVQPQVLNGMRTLPAICRGIEGRRHPKTILSSDEAMPKHGKTFDPTRHGKVPKYRLLPQEEHRLEELLHQQLATQGRDLCQIRREQPTKNRRLKLHLVPARRLASFQDLRV